MEEFVCYIIYSPKYNKIYIGYTNSIIERIKSHNHNHNQNKGYTKKFQPWVVAHLEFFDLKKDAMIREKKLKSSRGRADIWNKIIPDYLGLISVS